MGQVLYECRTYLNTTFSAIQNCRIKACDKEAGKRQILPSASIFFRLSHFSVQPQLPIPPQEPLMARLPKITPMAMAMTTASMKIKVTRK